MNFILLIAGIGFLDIAGRIGALIILMNDNNVRKLSYRTWVLLCMFLNFAWVFYFMIGRGKKDV